MRTLSPYEQTHLARFGKSQIKIEEYGEMPVEYITGKVEFAGMVFDVTEDTLIPRIETEELVTIAFDELVKMHQAEPARQLVVTDIGTGCGIIGVSLAKQLTEAKIPFRLFLADVSAAAIEVARGNADRLLDQSIKYEAVVSNLLADLPVVQHDLIAGNLPYIPTPRIDSLDESVRDFEPHLALDGGPEGLSLMQQLLQQAESLLRPTGKILLEVDYTHTAAEIIEYHPGRWSAELKKDSFGQNRFVIVSDHGQ